MQRTLSSVKAPETPSLSGRDEKNPRLQATLCLTLTTRAGLPPTSGQVPTGRLWPTATPALGLEGAKGLAWRRPSHREPGPASQEPGWGNGMEKRAAEHRPGHGWALGRLAAGASATP